MAAKRVRTRSRRVRPKLDPRLGFLLALSPQRLRAVKAHEDDRIRRLAETKQGAKPEARDRLLFAPLTTGVHFPSSGSEAGANAGGLKEPYLSVFLLSDASAGDLQRLGVRVRNQVGDLFTAFVPIALVPTLEASPAIRFIELARPLFPTLQEAIVDAQIATLHNASPAHKGAGVVIGIVDFVLDIYHPDFRTASDATRIRYLWDQTLTPQGAEQGPPTDPVLPGFMVGQQTYGVEYDQATIDAELNNVSSSGTAPYQTVRHHGGTDHVANHGTLVTGMAAGNGRGDQGRFTGAAPEADIIFVSYQRRFDITGFADSTDVADGFTYIFARAAVLGRPCVVNLSNSDEQGAHDGTTLGEQFLDGLLLTPGRAITLSAGNSNTAASHAAGSVPAGGTSNLVLNYKTADLDGDGVNDQPENSDVVEIWYDGHDRFDVTVTIPTAPPTVIGPVSPGQALSTALPNDVQVHVTSVLGDPRNGDNLLSIIFEVGPGQSIPLGNTTIALTGTTVINGKFQAWVDRNNRWLSAWQAPFLQANQLTLGVPATARRPITVGAHDKAAPPTPASYQAGGRGPTRDGRIKPEIASVGTGITAPRSRDQNASPLGPLYLSNKSGTSYSAPLVAGACALLFECRGASTTWANLKQILLDTAGTQGLSVPSNAFGFGFMQIATGCAQPAPAVDVWLRDHPTDTGLEPFTGPVAWLSPDIEVLDTAGNPVPNPTYDPTVRFRNLVGVTVRNRGTQTAHNTEVYLYWADPATNLPFPSAWNTSGFYTDRPAGAGTYTEQSNRIVIPTIAAGQLSQVKFAWAPPPPGSSLGLDNHFCLLARIENDGDPSGVGAGGWAPITAKNNIALKNVLVQQSPASASFYVVGSGDQDSLIVEPDLVDGQVEIALPVRALPWRDIGRMKRSGWRHLPYGTAGGWDPVADLRVTLEDRDVRARTGVEGAHRLVLHDGVASILSAPRTRLLIPDVRLTASAKMPARIWVDRPRTDRQHRFVHVAQLSGGQLVGGVTLQLQTY